MKTYTTENAMKRALFNACVLAAWEANDKNALAKLRALAQEAR